MTDTDAFAPDAYAPTATGPTGLAATTDPADPAAVDDPPRSLLVLADPPPVGDTHHRLADIRPDALLRRARASHPLGHLPTARVARAVLSRLLSQVATDHLTIVDTDGATTHYGPAFRHHDADIPGERLAATITVLDDRAWSAVITEGSIGFGRGYIEGWWTSDDPSTVVRIAIRSLRGLDELRNRIDWATAGMGDLVRRRLLPRPDRTHDRDDIASHYDLGNEFFALFLDETMTYSAGVFTSPRNTLAEASIAKYDRLLAKLDVSERTDMLEIGSGWGGLALRAAASRSCHITTTTVSKAQRAEAERRVADAGLDHLVSVLDHDWRDLRGLYDRIVSIEMIEAVDWRDYDRYFATIERCLAPDGLVGLQAICVPDRRYHRTKKTEDFIRRFVFPGGQLPSIGAIGQSVARATRLQLLDVEDLTAHYAETLCRWRARFDDRLDDIRALGLDERFTRLWRFYLAYCEAGFLERHVTVNQFVLAGPAWRPDGLDLRPC
ncbi:MAG: class I SAM-dependent methyltransferase [Acidimicrobiales bacterium]